MRANTILPCFRKSNFMLNMFYFCYTIDIWKFMFDNLAAVVFLLTKQQKYTALSKLNGSTWIWKQAQYYSYIDQIQQININVITTFALYNIHNMYTDKTRNSYYRQITTTNCNIKQTASNLFLNTISLNSTIKHTMSQKFNFRFTLLSISRNIPSIDWFKNIKHLKF